MRSLEKYFCMRNKLTQSWKKMSRLKEDQGPRPWPPHTATQTTLNCPPLPPPPPPPVVSNHSVLPWITSCLLISLAVIFFKIYNWWRKQRLLVKWNFCRFLVMKLKQLRRRLWRDISVKKGEPLKNNIKTTTLPVHHCKFLPHHYHARLFMEGGKTRRRIFLSISEIRSGSLRTQLQDNLPTTTN